MILSLAASLACAHGGLPTTTIRVGAEHLTVEVADDPLERARGLMYRDKLGADAGMIFVYPDEAPRQFWMKDTRIPLSIAFLDAQGVVVSVSEMLPLDLNTTPSNGPAMYALEMNRGWFAAHGVRPGDVLGDLPAAAAR